MQNNAIHPTFQFRSGIPALYRDMMRQGIVREAFNFTINGVTLKSIFLIDRKPFELIVGVVGTQFGFIIKLHKGFTAEWLNDADLWELRKLLNLKDQAISSPPSSCSGKLMPMHQPNAPVRKSPFKILPITEEMCRKLIRYSSVVGYSISRMEGLFAMWKNASDDGGSNCRFL